jgi:hypothetical protein
MQNMSIIQHDINLSKCHDEMYQVFHKKKFRSVMEELELLPGNRLALDAEKHFNELLSSRTALNIGSPEMQIQMCINK